MNNLNSMGIDPNGLEKWGSKAKRLAITLEGEKIGEIELVYHNDSTVHINKVWLFEGKQNQGYGTQLYIKLGSELAAEGKVLISREDRTDLGQKLWEKLTREGFARIRESNTDPKKIVYEFVKGN